MDNKTDKPLLPNELLGDSYDQWIKNPVTQLFIKILKKRSDNCVNFIGVNVTRIDVSDAQFRQYGHTLKATRDVFNIVTNYELFRKSIDELIKPSE